MVGDLENVRVIGEDDKVQCQWCLEAFEAKTWNEETFKECVTREMRRAFKPIYNTKVWAKDSGNYYKCPRCSLWSNGSQLVLLDKDGQRVKGLGGKPVITLVKNNKA